MNNILETLYSKFSTHHAAINKFFDDEFAKHPAIIYNSCDLRHSGFKICPVDTNCFPAGFNNLGESSKKEATQIANAYLNTHFPQAQKIIILAENHTRNLRYLANILDLTDILSDKCKVVVGTLMSEVDKELTIDLEDRQLTLEKLINDNGNIKTVNGFEADLVVLNNDLTDGVDTILANSSTPIIPDISLGWYKRTKSHHFEIYTDLATKLSNILDIDPWFICALCASCDDINFKEKTGLSLLSQKVDETINILKEKYHKYNISDEPYVYVKADNGTYGMAIWQVSSGQEILDINKKNRNKMNVIKGSVQNTKILIQEGVRTIDKINQNFAEPMIYMINGQVIGNLFRVNESRDEKSSLNSPGAIFFDLQNLNESQIELGLTKDKISLIYKVVARLAALATAIENKNV